MGWFKIEVSEKLVEVKTAEIKPRLTVSSVVTILVFALLGIYALAKMLPVLVLLLTTAHRFNIWNWLIVIAMLFYGVALLWGAFRMMFPSGESLVCNADTLTIGRIPNYTLTGRWIFESFPTKSVKQLTFTSVRVSRYGSTLGLVFHADGKKKKILSGLEAPEADQILQGLSRLGVDMVHDPAMPMMIEMVVSRRKSRLGLF